MEYTGTKAWTFLSVFRLFWHMVETWGYLREVCGYHRVLPFLPLRRASEADQSAALSFGESCKYIRKRMAEYKKYKVIVFLFNTTLITILLLFIY